VNQRRSASSNPPILQSADPTDPTDPTDAADGAPWAESPPAQSANYLGGDYVAGRDNLANAMHCPAAIGNPFIHFRLGQCQFELGNLDRAADELMRAYMGAGREIFDQDDPKYFQFLATRAKDVR
jgi:hypothetical protein